MNEMEMRRRLLADPRYLDAATETALRASPSLTALRASLLATDNAIAGVLGEALPPKGLADRIILRARHRRSTRWGLAMAASVVLAAAVTWIAVSGRPEAIVVAMIDHVIESPEELADNGHVSGDEARASLQRIGVSFRDAGYQIRHIGECVVAGRVGRHLIINTPEGLATLLVLPMKAGELAQRRVVSKGNFMAVVMPQSTVVIAAVGPGSATPQRLESLARQMFTLES